MWKKRIDIGNIIEVIFIYILLSSFIFNFGDDPRLTRIVNHLSKFNKEFPQQKVYLHLDKTDYSAGEIIWFKAYLINAASQLPDTMSTNLYVELVNTRNIRVQVHMLRMTNGIASGDFSLMDTVTEGNYLIKAYTDWMNNFDVGLIFKKKIYIKNPENKNFISAEDIRFNKKFNRKRGKVTDQKNIQFLPEGGELIYGVPCRIAFKAVNGSGKGIDVEGSIRDNQGNEVALLHSIHLGMGVFSIRPETGKTYEARLKLAGAEEMKVKLPQPLEYGISMFVDNQSSEEFINIKLHAKLPPSQDEIVRDFMVMCQTNGNLCFSNLFHFKSDSFSLSVPKEKFPSGISQITIFNGRGVPVAERLVFINHHDDLSFDIIGNRDTVPDMNQVRISLKVHNKKGQAIEGNFSASITDADQVTDDPDECNIVNTFRLSSDIKGIVEKPNYYFNSVNADKEMALDLLMMTQGWRRFDWKKILADQFPKIDFSEEKGIVITGKITKDFFKIPVKKAPVYLTILSSYNDYFATQTDDNGLFRFGGLVYYDTMSVVVEASKPNSRKNVQILIDETQSPRAIVQEGESFEQEVLAKGDNWKYEKVRRPDNGARDRERKKLREKYAPFRLYTEADNVLYMDDIPDGYNSMFQAIQGRVPGVTVIGNGVQIRGISSIMGDPSPLYLVDGEAVDASTFGALNPRDVEMVEFLKGSSASIYGIRGSNGVIAAYTRRGEFMKRGYIDFKMLAYYTPRKFYTTSVLSSTTNSSEQKLETVYWAPVIKTGTSGEGTITFKLKDKIRIRLKVEGISLNGIPGYAKEILNF